MNILLTNVGRRTYFINFLIDLKKEENLTIHLSDCDKNSAAFYPKKKTKFHLTCRVKSNRKRYIKDILKITKENNINLIIPLSDLDLYILSKHKFFFYKLNCFPIISSPEVINTCFDKIKLSKFCEKNNINYPHLYKNKKEIGSGTFTKKEIRGSGSSGLEKIRNKKFLKEFNDRKFIFQKYIKGQEYHLDIFNDLKGNYISTCIKKKILMRSGETDKCEIIHNRKIELFSKTISKCLKHIGNLDCDIILNNKKKIFLIDLNPRFGGGYPFTHLAGLNYLLALVRMSLKKKFNLSRKAKLITCMKGISLHYYYNN